MVEKYNLKIITANHKFSKFTYINKISREAFDKNFFRFFLTKFRFIHVLWIKTRTLVQSHLLFIKAYRHSHAINDLKRKKGRKENKENLFGNVYIKLSSPHS